MRGWPLKVAFLQVETVSCDHIFSSQSSSELCSLLLSLFFADEEALAERHEAVCLRSHRQGCLNFNLCLSDTDARALETATTTLLPELSFRGELP